MSYTISPEETSWDSHPDQQGAHSRRLLTVVAGAVLFVLGIVIGGFMTRSQAPSLAAPTSDELATLRAKIDLLTVQATESKGRSTELEQLLITQRAHLTREREASRLTHHRQAALEHAVRANHANRELCLNELERLESHPGGVPTSQVIHFVNTVYDNQSKTLNVLASDEADLSSILALEASLKVAPFKQVEHPVEHTHATVSVPTPAGPTLAEPTLAEPTGIHSHRQSVFFSAPPRRKQGVMFITPRTPSRVASHQNSGMKFMDDSDADRGPVFR